MKSLIDRFGRIHDYLRVSLTDRCNLNCIYCNPVSNTSELNKTKTIDAQKINRLLQIFLMQFGFRKIRFTGGEPLVRKDFDNIITMTGNLKKQYDFELSITTNGLLLNNKLLILKESGMDKLNISLDSLRENVFEKLTGHNSFWKVIGAVEKALSFGFSSIKINCVVIKGYNDNEILDFIKRFGHYDVHIRFIEYMPFTNNGWDTKHFISSEEIKSILESGYEMRLLKSEFGSVSRDYSVVGQKCKVGFISSISDNFCSSCSRLRISSEGNLRLCLFSEKESELNINRLLDEPSFNDIIIADIIREHLNRKAYEHPPIEDLIKMDFNYMLKAGG